MIKIANKHLSYPLMRDPQRNPKCYELTDNERLESIKLADQLLKEQELKKSNQYWGA